MSYSNPMANDHHHCDELFAAAEQVVEGGEWLRASESHRRFIEAMRHHLEAEEQLLFPAFEAASGMTQGPTSVMRHEHEQMRGLFAQMDQAVAAQSGDDYLGASETLLILMQQHNAKEEQILYPMLDQMLAPQADELLPQLAERIDSAGV
ncbi:MAG: hemerythrin domain-containing protein [Chromatiales bacterium]|nr:hemerythrin domain-containing protein [Chromatiales bacterium]